MMKRAMFYRQNLYKIYAYIVLLAFLVTSINVPGGTVFAQESFTLPAPGVMVRLSPEFNPAILKGIKVYPENPFRFDFILDKGDSELGNNQLKDESSKLIKYFLASLTIPEKDLWVNLSPYEKDRIIPQSFGLTEMGRDLLAEDYMLKQITASLIYPEDEVGKKFWKRIYEEAFKKYGTTDIPVNTFNKVWIVPEKAVVYENAKAGTAYVVESKLRLCLNRIIFPLRSMKGVQFEQAQTKDTNQLGSQVVREVVIPELTKEVNENKNFTKLRQVYNSLILATWYKKKIKDSILTKVYADKNKVVGVNINDPREKEKIYQRYLQAFKKGVYNYIKEDHDPVTQETLPRKYFSGGVDETTVATGKVFSLREGVPPSSAMISNDHAMIIEMKANPVDMAMPAVKGVGIQPKHEKFVLDQKQYPLWKTNALMYLTLDLLDDDSEQVRLAGVKQIGEIAKAKPELMNESVRDALVGKLSDSDSDVRQAAANAIGEIAKAKPELMNESVRDALVGKLSDREWYVRQAAANAIGEIAKAKPELMNESVRDALVGKLSDRDGMYGKQRRMP